MVLEWIERTNKIKALYWSENINVDTIKKDVLSCDILQIWYPQNVSQDIFEEYGIVMSFIEFNGKWKGESHSSIIDLRLSPEDILKGFSGNRRYKTKRAENRDNLEIVFYIPESEEDLREYVEFYNEFARSKSKNSINYNKVLSLTLARKLEIAKVMTEDKKILAIHGYLLAPEDDKVTLFTSSSLFRNDTNNASVIGRANGLLHYKSMLHFKQKGFREYDFGGMYMKDDNEELANITKYKKGFGGKIVAYDCGFVIPIKELEIILEKLDQCSELIMNNKVIVWGAGLYGKYTIDRLNKIYHKSAEFIIDNKLCQESEQYCPDSILDSIPLEEVVVLVTTTVQSFELIRSQKNCRELEKKNRLIGLRQK